MSEADKLRHAREHDRNRLHKDPPPGYIEKKMEEHGQGHGGSLYVFPSPSISNGVRVELLG